METSTVKRYLPWVVATALFMEQLDTTIVNTAVPAMAQGLGVTPLSLKAVVASYILSLAVCIPVSGWTGRPLRYAQGVCPRGRGIYGVFRALRAGGECADAGGGAAAAGGCALR